MSEVLADPTAELEEALGLELPCGGNLSPVARPCPDQAPATLASTHRRCNPGPEDYKCNRCSIEWVPPNDVIKCASCGACLSVAQIYRPV